MIATERLTKEELDYFKGLLLAEKNKVWADQKFISDQNLKQTIADSTGESSHYSNHLGDAAALSYEREFAMTLSERQSKYLEQVDDSLLRIEEGVYGICQITGKKIPKERLEAVLTAKYSVEGKELLKKRMGR
jgi:RNA polymerase-binding protein DksA